MKTILKTIPFFSTIIIVLLVYSIYANTNEYPTFTIFYKPDGGDCQKIGKWNLSSKTCTLSKDLVNIQSIQVGNSGLIIDGNGNTIYGNGDGVGVKIMSKSKVTIKNLNIVNFTDGVFLENSYNNTLTNLKINSNTRHGIFLLDNSNNNIISFNNIGPSTMHGIRIDYSQNNIIVSNTIKQTRDGIRLGNSEDTIISRNDFTENRVEAIDLHNSNNVVVFYNNIMELEAEPIVDQNPFNNTFFISSGGNYYSVFDEPFEGCSDQNSDGFCDSPYVFDDGHDSLAFIKKNGMSKDRFVLIAILTK